MVILTPGHILITFAFWEKSKGISNICIDTQSLFNIWNNEVCPFSAPRAKIHTIDLIIALNKLFIY